MNRYIACLWHGTDLPSYSGTRYDPVWVERLHRNIHRHDPNGHLTMLCDETYAPECDGLCDEVLLLSGDDCGGWSKMLEPYRPDLAPVGLARNVIVGLDTVFVGDPRWLFNWCGAPVGLPIDPLHPKEMCDAVVSFDAHGAHSVWNFYQAEKARNQMADHHLFGSPSEMILLRHMAKTLGWAPLEPAPKKLLSYKAHVRRGAKWKDASIVYFHGKPKPDALPAADPIRMEWEKC